jgi:hypothetical protein
VGCSLCPWLRSLAKPLRVVCSIVGIVLDFLKEQPPATRWETSDVVTHFTLRGSQYIYHADRDSRVHDKPLHVTIHGNVEFAVVGRSIYLKDEDGKAHKLVSMDLPR